MFKNCIYCFICEQFFLLKVALVQEEEKFKFHRLLVGNRQTLKEVITEEVRLEFNKIQMSTIYEIHNKLVDKFLKFALLKKTTLQ